MGTAILLAWGAPPNEAIFVGASMVATSVGITAQVLSAKGLLHAVSSKIILAAAVIDDVLGLLVLAVVSSLTHGKVDFLQLGLTALAAVAFTVIVAKWGTHAMGRVVPHVDRTESGRGAVRAGDEPAVRAGAAGGLHWRGGDRGRVSGRLALGESAGPRERDLAQGSRNCWCRSSWPASACTWISRRSPTRERLCWRS